MALHARDLNRLAAELDGALLLPDDPAYDSTRRWLVGGFHDVVPQAVARCAGAADVATALAFAQRHDLPFAVRSGGHSFADFSTTDGLLIDLADLDSVSWPPDGQDVVRVGPGRRAGNLTEQLADHGRLVPTGWAQSVAVGGLVLGGGFGPFTRYYGLGCDHLVGAEVVLADGRTVWTDTEHEPELFWAIRGAGGGNFGVVTSMLLRTRPSVPAVTFAAWWPLTRAVALIDAWQQRAPSAPDPDNVELVLSNPPDPAADGEAMLLGLVVDGEESFAHRWIDELAAAAGAADTARSVVPLDAAHAPRRRCHAGPEAKTLAVTGRPAGVPAAMRLLRSNFFAGSLPRPALATLIERFTADRVSGEYRELEFVAWGGAPARMAPDDTAFVHRKARFLVQATVINFGDRQTRAASHRRVNALRAAINPWADGHVYPNYPDPDLAHPLAAYYGANLPRLQCVKAAYDPDNVFRFAHSIPPPTGVSREKSLSIS